MPNQTRELYREYTPWAPWVYAVLWGAMGIPALASWSSLSVVLLLCAALLQVVFAGLLVTVERDGVRVGLGRARLFRTFIPFSEITRLESVTYKPLREFGGWGLRGGRDKRAWTARGDRAVVVHTEDERRIYIGSDDTKKLESRLRNAMSLGGHGLGGAAGTSDRS